MPKSHCVARLVFNRLPRVSAELAPMASQVVRKTAFDVQATAQDLSAVDTGAQKASIYTDTDDGSTYREAVGAASKRRPGSRFLPAVPRPNDLSAIVGVGVEYGIYNELRGRAFMGPAAEQHRGSFEAAMREALQGL